MINNKIQTENNSTTCISKINNNRNSKIGLT